MRSVLSENVSPAAFAAACHVGRRFFIVDSLAGPIHRASRAGYRCRLVRKHARARESLPNVAGARQQAQISGAELFLPFMLQ
jgi:hypothetical protein